MLFKTAADVEKAYDDIAKGMPPRIFFNGVYTEDTGKFTFRVSMHEHTLVSPEIDVERVTFVLLGTDIEIYASSVLMDVVQVDNVNEFTQFVIDLTRQICTHPDENPVYDDENSVYDDENPAENCGCGNSMFDWFHSQPRQDSNPPCWALEDENP